MLLGTESLQTFGGSGFLQDYPIEQYVRDAKIDTLYEGTTAIQGLDFFFRKIVKDQGQALGHLAERDPGVRSRPRGRQRPAQGGARAARPRRSRTCRASSARWSGDLMTRDPQPRAATRQHLQGRPEHHPAADGARRRGRRLAAAAAGRGRARGARRAAPSAKDKAFYEGKVAAGAVLRPHSACPGSPPSARSPRRTDAR